MRDRVVYNRIYYVQGQAEGDINVTREVYVASLCPFIRISCVSSRELGKYLTSSIPHVVHAHCIHRIIVIEQSS